MKFKLIIDTEETTFETIGQLQLYLAVAYKIGFGRKLAHLVQAGVTVELENENYNVTIKPIGD